MFLYITITTDYKPICPSRYRYIIFLTDSNHDTVVSRKMEKQQLSLLQKTKYISVFNSMPYYWLHVMHIHVQQNIAKRTTCEIFQKQWKNIIKLVLKLALKRCLKNYNTFNSDY